MWAQRRVKSSAESERDSRPIGSSEKRVCSDTGGVVRAKLSIDGERMAAISNNGGGSGGAKSASRSSRLSQSAHCKSSAKSATGMRLASA